MRFGKIVSVAILAAVFGFSPAVLAGGKSEDTVKSRRTWWKSSKHQEKKTDAAARTQSTASRDQAARGSNTIYGYVGEDRGPANVQVATGAYRYVFTGADGKYDYFLDHYGYPYAYGGRPMSPPPAGVFGYIPPEQSGGGPVCYFRHERPVSWSARRSTMSGQ
jgi:hypothetical protein